MTPSTIKELEILPCSGQGLHLRFRSILKRLEVNRAVAFNILSQVWNAVAVPATMLVIAHWMSAAEQGFYYTFTSVLALQVFVELGLGAVVVQTASHEWAFLDRDASGEISGDPKSLSRLASLLRFSFNWYAVCGVVVAIGLGAGGYMFFAANREVGILWQAPWLLLCGAAGLNLLLIPVLSILDGCNQVNQTYTFRFVQATLNSLAIIIAIILGSGLFSPFIGAVVRLIAGVMFVIIWYRKFIYQLIKTKVVEAIDWRGEVWPFQSRIAISWLCGYFIFWLFTPVMFHFWGAVVAGQIGMTVQMTNAVPSLAYSWVQTRMPKFGVLIARGEYPSLDGLFKKLMVISVGISIVVSVIVLGLMVWLNQSGLKLADRLLGPLPVAILLIAGVINTVVFVLAGYLRAHKKEPLLWSAVIAAACVGVSVTYFGARFGPIGAVISYLVVTAAWCLPSSIYIFRNCRKIWHSTAEANY